MTWKEEEEEKKNIIWQQKKIHRRKPTINDEELQRDTQRLGGKAIEKAAEEEGRQKGEVL